MDWSLVLASQGIEAIIEPPAENGDWGLVIPARDSEKAFKTLRQYRLENRDWSWRHPLPWPETHFDWMSLAWAALLVFFHWATYAKPGFRDAGIMASNSVHAGEWWRVFTAITLHADVAHLAENLSIGIVLFGLAMGRYGTGTGLLASYLAGVCGNLVSLWFSARPFQGLGASGMVMGALGLLAAQTVPTGGRAVIPMTRKLAGVGAAVLLFILYGLSPGTDTAAHLGGLVAGLLLGIILARLPQRFCANLKVNVITGLALLGAVAGTWWLALRK
jgi:membrane associated rhomboid family serine protease